MLSTTGRCLWRDEQIRVYEAAKFGDFVVFDSLIVFDSLKEKRGIVTANLTTPYIVNWTNLPDGPVLADYPQGQTAGGVLDFWQRPVADLGLTGTDAGKRSKYMVIAPQEDASKHADSGGIVIQAASNNVFIGLRILNPDRSSLRVSRRGWRCRASERNLGRCASSKGLTGSGARPRREGWPTGTAWRRSSARSRCVRWTRS